MVNFKDYYQILGVSKDAPEKDIKQAYRRLARQYHPDVNRSDPNAEARFKEINESYEVLSDKDKRAKYDQLGAYWDKVPSGAGGASYGYGPGGYRTVDFDASGLEDILSGTGGDFSDFFNIFFGEGSQNRDFSWFTSKAQRRSAPAELPEQEYLLEISLEEAYFGATKNIQLQTRTRTKTIEVKIPAGVKDGTVIRLRGENLLLKIRIRPHGLFKVDGRDLNCEIPIAVTEAVLGADIEIPVLNGKVTMKVPPLTQSGRVFRLKAQGLPGYRNEPPGDLYIKINIIIPKHLSDREKELYKQLAQIGSEKPRAGIG